VTGVALLLALFAWWYRIRARTRCRPWEVGSRSSSRAILWWEPSRDRDVGEPKWGTSTLASVVCEKETRFELVPLPQPPLPPTRPGLPSELRPSASVLPTLATFAADEQPRTPLDTVEPQPDDIGTPREPQHASFPRYLSLDNDGLDVPWSTKPRNGLNASSPIFLPETAFNLEGGWRSRLAARPLPEPPVLTDESWTDSLCRRANLIQGFNLFTGGARAPVNSTDFAALGSTGSSIDSLDGKENAALILRVPQRSQDAGHTPRTTYAAHFVESPAHEPPRAEFVPPPVPPLPPQFQGVLRNPHSIDNYVSMARGEAAMLLGVRNRAASSMITHTSKAGALSRSSSIALSRSSSVALSRGPTMTRAAKNFRLDEGQEATHRASRARGRRAASGDL
jgi:hypothetical protein